MTSLTSCLASLALPLLLLLATVAPEARSQSTDYLEGELDVLIPEGRPLRFFLRNSNGSVASVALNDTAAELLTPYAGYNVRLRRSSNGNAGRSPRPSRRPSRNLLAKNKSPPPPLESSLAPFEDFEILGPADESNAGKNTALGPSNITSVVFLLSFCGFRPAMDANSFRAQWTNDASTPAGAYTMQNYWANCSQGMARMTSEQQTVVEVPLPCTGTNMDKQFNFANKCGDAELYAWMNLAEDYTRTVIGRDISSIKQRIAVLPKELGKYCGWAGLASVGCTGTRCYTWINGVAVTDLTLYLHEMGHNMGLLHSGRNGTAFEYGDYTCAMGIGPACLNAANTWRLGWAKPVKNGDLNASNLPVGRWQSYQLPYQSRALESQVRVFTDWAPPTTSYPASTLYTSVPAFYISLRTRATPFEKLSTRDVPPPGRVLVHSSNATQIFNSYQRTRLEAAVAPGGTFRAPLPSGLVVRVATINAANGADISVCRADRKAESAADESCFDGLDNDCDGLSDDQDPDCAGAPKNPAPISSPPPVPVSSPPPAPISSPPPATRRKSPPPRA